MANWAKLQEQLTGLPVVKRARHGIHFDKGNGEIVANFSGKPCHYQDTDGLWKPIDTKLLLLPDGFYGSPHSDVKIHKDGRVKAGGYQQKSALVAAKEGVVDGDKIVREFKFGTQYLYMKEDGFRQETVITRPPTTAEAKYLIASESGELPSKYKRSDITAVDADGAVHEFVNLGQFKKWLDSAAYPVTIDPDFSAASGGGRIYSYQQLTYADARNNYYSYGNNALWIGQTFDGTYYGVQRTAIQFDTSSIPDDATVTQANLSVTTLSYGWNAGVDFIAHVVKHTWTGDYWGDTNFDAILAADFEAVLLDTADITGGTFTSTSDNLDTTRINKTGYTQYGLISENDRDNIAPTGSEFLYWDGSATKLSVTYTTGSTGVPKHFLHYARLRSN